MSGAKSFADRLADSLLGRRTFETRPEEEEILPLDTMLSQLMELSEKVWLDYAFSREVQKTRIPATERVRLEKEALGCGREHGMELKSRFPSSTPRQIARQLGLRLDSNPNPDTTLRVVFAAFTPPDVISLNQTCLDKAEQCLKQCRDLPLVGRESLEDLLLAHELFHWVEEQEQDHILTRTARVTPASRLLPVHGTPRYLGEIAGMEFARQLLDLPFSPFAMDVLFAYGMNPRLAWQLYRDMIRSACLAEQEKSGL